MPTLAEREQKQGDKIILIGDSGVGKTRMIGTFPDPYIYDFENKLEVLGAREDIQYEDCFSTSENPGAGWSLLKKAIKEWRVEPKAQTFVIDSLSRAADSCLAGVLKSQGRTGQVQLGDWGLAIGEIKDQLGFLSTLRCNVVLIAHYRMLQDDVLGGFQYTPLIYGKDLPTLVPGYFTNMWRLLVEPLKQPTDDAVYKMQIKPTGRFDSVKNGFSDEVNKKLPLFVKPDYTALKAVVAGSASVDTIKIKEKK